MLRDKIAVYLSRSKVSLRSAMKEYAGSGSTAPLYLNLGTRWWWMVCFTLRPFYTRGTSPVPTEYEICWDSLSGRFGDGNNHLPLLEVELRIV